MKCLNCGFENNDNVKFCGNCGHPLNKENNNTPPPNKINTDGNKNISQNSNGNNQFNNNNPNNNPNNQNYNPNYSNNKPIRNKESEKNNNDKNLKIIGGVCLLVILLIIIFAAVSPDNSSTSSYGSSSSSSDYTYDYNNVTITNLTDDIKTSYGFCTGDLTGVVQAEYRDNLTIGVIWYDANDINLGTSTAYDVDYVSAGDKYKFTVHYYDSEGTKPVRGELRVYSDRDESVIYSQNITV